MNVLKYHLANVIKAFLYSTLCIEAVVLGGSGGLAGKYNRRAKKDAPTAAVSVMYKTLY